MDITKALIAGAAIITLAGCQTNETPEQRQARLARSQAFLQAGATLNNMANNSYRPMQPPRVVNTRCIQHPTGEVDCTSM